MRDKLIIEVLLADGMETERRGVIVVGGNLRHDWTGTKNLYR